MWLMRREFQQYSYQEEPAYQNFQKRRSFAAFALPIAFLACFISSLVHVNIQDKELEASLSLKAESYTGEDKNFFDSKFSELKGSMGESRARKKAIELTDKNIEYNNRINNFNDEKKAFFNEKINEYKHSMDDFSAKERAIKDTDEEFDKRDKELQKKYDDQKQYEEWIAWQEAEKEKAEKAELQKKYDDQKQYEEWIAWQQAEKEKAEKAELQKKYDDQKVYEEWIAWQKSENDKKLAAEAEERARQQAEINKYTQVEVNTLYRSFKSNAARANRDYSGKYVKIVGSAIRQIESEADVVLTGIYIRQTYAEYDYIEGFIHCYPKTSAAKESIYNMNNNQYIIIYGKVREVGELMGFYIDVDKFEY